MDLRRNSSDCNTNMEKKKKKRSLDVNNWSPKIENEIKDYEFGFFFLYQHNKTIKIRIRRHTQACREILNYSATGYRPVKNEFDDNSTSHTCNKFIL